MPAPVEDPDRPLIRLKDTELNTAPAEFEVSTELAEVYVMGQNMGIYRGKLTMPSGKAITLVPLGATYTNDSTNNRGSRGKLLRAGVFSIDISGTLSPIPFQAYLNTVGGGNFGTGMTPDAVSADCVVPTHFSIDQTFVPTAPAPAFNNFVQTVLLNGVFTPVAGLNPYVDMGAGPLSWGRRGVLIVESDQLVDVALYLGGTANPTQIIMPLGYADGTRPGRFVYVMDTWNPTPELQIRPWTVNQAPVIVSTRGNIYALAEVRFTFSDTVLKDVRSKAMNPNSPSPENDRPVLAPDHMDIY